MKGFKKILFYGVVIFLILFTHLEYQKTHQRDWQYERAYEVAVEEITKNLYAPTQAQIPKYNKKYVQMEESHTILWTINDGSYLDGRVLDIDVTDFRIQVTVTAPNLFGVMLTDTYEVTVAIPDDPKSFRSWIAYSND